MQGEDIPQVGTGAVWWGVGALALSLCARTLQAR